VSRVYIEVTDLAAIIARLERAESVLDSCAIVQTEPKTYQALVEVRGDMAHAGRELHTLYAKGAKIEQYLGVLPDNDDFAEIFGADTTTRVLQ
jgi:hypothetical protein